MATLSKMVIENIAQRMTENSKKYYEKLRKDYRELATIIYETQVPEKVKELFKTHPDFVITSSSVRVDGSGFNREDISLSKSLPSTCSYPRLTFSSPQADKLVKAKRKFEKAKDEYELLVRETQSALLALKTEKNIRENLPEAVPFLPPPMSNSLVVNFKSLQERLNKQPESKEYIEYIPV